MRVNMRFGIVTIRLERLVEEIEADDVESRTYDENYECKNQQLLRMAQQNANCEGCKKPISGPVITAMGKTWHPEHFVCTTCHKPLQGVKFNHKDNKPYCEEDYTKLFSEKCAKCNQPIKEKMIVAMGKNWHQEHFVCTKCGKPLTGQQFCERDGNPYCQKDFAELFASKCAGCNQPITDTALVALEKHWHQACFKCKKCGKPITEAMFQVEDDRPVCARCSAK